MSQDQIRTSLKAKELFQEYIFPCKNKIPAIPKGTSWKKWSGEITTDLVGLNCGKAGIVVFDFDSYKPEFNKESMLYQQVGGATKFIQTTQSGGEHYFFKNKHNLHNKAFTGAGIEIRGKGGYVCLYSPAFVDAYDSFADFYNALPDLPEDVYNLIKDIKPLKSKDIRAGAGRNNEFLNSGYGTFANKSAEQIVNKVFEITQEFSIASGKTSIEEAKQKLSRSLSDGLRQQAEKLRGNLLRDNNLSNDVRPKNKELEQKYKDLKKDGFRFKADKGEPKGIRYNDLIDYLKEVELIFCDNRGTIYRYDSNLKFYKQYGFNQLVSDYGDLISPDIKANEISQLDKKMRHTKIKSITDIQKQNEDCIFFKDKVLRLGGNEIKTEDYDPTKHMNFYNINSEYDPQAECPRFTEVLNFAFRGKEKEQHFFLIFLVNALFNSKFNPEKALVMCGSGANGKSTLINALSDMFSEGSNIIAPIELESLYKDDSHLAIFSENKIAYSSDTPENFLKARPDLVKKIISGEILAFRPKYSKDVFKFRNTCRLILSMNKPPILKENTEAVRRRFVFLGLNNIVREENRDEGLRDKLKHEKAGIFNLLIRYYKNKLPKIDDSILNQALEVGDLVCAFINQKIEITTEEDRLHNHQLYTAFENFAEGEGENKIPTKRKFLRELYQRLSEASAEVGKYNQGDYRGLFGIRFKSDKYFSVVPKTNEDKKSQLDLSDQEIKF